MAMREGSSPLSGTQAVISRRETKVGEELIAVLDRLLRYNTGLYVLLAQLVERPRHMRKVCGSNPQWGTWSYSSSRERRLFACCDVGAGDGWMRRHSGPHLSW